MAGTRAFTQDDIAAVVEMRLHEYSQSRQVDANALAAYFRRIFFEGPFRDEQLRSWVYEDSQGRIIGFIGVFPKLLRLNGSLVRCAVSTQFMVRRDSRGLPGAALLKKLFEGPQDLTLADNATEQVRRMWVGLGGKVSAPLSLTWNVPLKPAQTAAAMLISPALPAWAGSLLKPLWWTIDRSARNPFDKEPNASGSCIDATSKDVLALMSQHEDRDQFTLQVGAAEFEWLVDQMAERTDLGTLHRKIVLSRDGARIGAFLLFSGPNRIAQTAHLIAPSSNAGLVVAHLLREAHRTGASSVAGRFAPALVPTLSTYNAYYQQRGSWFLYHSRNGQICDALLRTESGLSRIDGEWWMNF